MRELDEDLNGQPLNERWSVRPAHALYRRTGDWYHRLRRFPARSSTTTVTRASKPGRSTSHRLICGSAKRFTCRAV